MSARSLKWMLCVVAIMCGSLMLVAVDAHSNPADVPSTGPQPGIYRDLQGNLWCGGICDPERQRCCTWSPI